MARKIRPGYDTGSFSEQFYETVICGFARQVYARFVAKKYGIDTCVEDEFSRLWIKKQLLDFGLIHDEDLCCEVECLAPCGAVASLQIYISNSCFRPLNPQAQIIVAEFTYGAPTGVSGEISYQGL